MTARCRFLFLLLCLATCVGPTGCRRYNHQDLLENELRARDLQFREVIDELKKSEFQRDALQRELESVRMGQKITPELAAHSFGVRRLTLGRGTSGIDKDQLPGDDGLQVILEPRDADDNIIKAPGNLVVTALEISPQGTKTPISTWELTAEQMRQTWKQGLFSTGYILALPWKSWPQAENVRVIVRLTLADGRVFEADKDVRIRLPQGVPPRPLPNPEGPPLHEPNGKSDGKNGVHQAAWQPAPLGKVELGRPEPVEPPPAVNLMGVINEEDLSPQR